MGSVQDKLRHFNDVILKDAALERDSILKDVRTYTEEQILREEKKIKEQADKFLKKEITQAENEKNSIISRAFIQSRQMLVKTREEIIDAVFCEAKERLRNFVKGENYLDFLKKVIVNSCYLAGSEKLIVYLSKDDMEKLPSLLAGIEKELPQDTIFEQTDEDIIGGCKVVNISLGIIVNNTLMQKLEVNRDSILEICNLEIE